MARVVLGAVRASPPLMVFHPLVQLPRDPLAAVFAPGFQLDFAFAEFAGGAVRHVQPFLHARPVDQTHCPWLGSMQRKVV
jgi:hypothetical protein